MTEKKQVGLYLTPGPAARIYVFNTRDRFPSSGELLRRNVPDNASNVSCRLPRWVVHVSVAHRIVCRVLIAIGAGQSSLARMPIVRGISSANLGATIHA
jgi:hypothetical protein